VEVEYTGRNVVTNKFHLPPDYGRGARQLLLLPDRHRVPQLEYGWWISEEIIQAIYKEAARYPLLLRVRGLEKGRFYILTTPEKRERSLPASGRKCWARSAAT